MSKAIFFGSLVSIIFFSCVFSTQKKDLSDKKFINPNLLPPKVDSFASAIVRQVVSSDTTKSEKDCSLRINFFDATHKVIVQKEIKTCLSDTRVVWGHINYFRNNGDTILIVTVDGVNNAMRVKQFL